MNGIFYLFQYCQWTWGGGGRGLDNCSASNSSGNVLLILLSLSLVNLCNVPLPWTLSHFHTLLWASQVSPLQDLHDWLRLALIFRFQAYPLTQHTLPGSVRLGPWWRQERCAGWRGGVAAVGGYMSTSPPLLSRKTHLVKLLSYEVCTI